MTMRMGNVLPAGRLSAHGSRAAGGADPHHEPTGIGQRLDGERLLSPTDADEHLLVPAAGTGGAGPRPRAGGDREPGRSLVAGARSAAHPHAEEGVPGDVD